ncbi:AAA family ATPase [Lunatibacter salilacus]|uniref:AAA family ATPase n=1 Tax=Lunatibacter salilacus TaxID=2483804 RepID=UPI00131E52C2|nr:ATP-binding protein [Lunatibacter salilacus]
MRAPSNPFILSGYHSPAYFCNRQMELAWLEEQFRNERNAVLYAYRRMGKTALIKHFFYHLEKEKRAKTVFLDLLGTSSMPEANKKLANAIVQKFGNINDGIGKKMLAMLSSLGATIGLDPISGAPQVTFGLVQPTEVERSMEAIGSFLKETKQPVVIAIDEFQQITEYATQKAEAVFRSWTQEFPMIRFIFSGSHRQMMQTMFTDQNRPFYNSAQLWSLEPIGKMDYATFIRAFFKKANLEISEPLLDKIFEWCRMQTYYVQLICNKLYGRRQTVNDELLLEVQQETVQQEAPLFSTYQHLLTDFQWRTLKAIALHETVQSPTSQEFLAKYKLGAASSVSTALKLLVKKEFVVYQNDHYRLHDTLLMRWFQQI